MIANPIRAAAEIAAAQRFETVPIKPRSKAPVGLDWQNRTQTLDEYAADGGLGVHLTEASRVVDIDLDSEYARRLAPRFLPETTMKYGRPSKPASHWVYRTDKPVKHQKFNGLAPKETLLERRCGRGKQTVIPPSVHPSGEPIAYLDGCGLTPSEVSGRELSRAADKLAAAALIASLWKDDGSVERHQIPLAVSAFLLKSGAEPELVTEILTAVYEAYAEPGRHDEHRRSIEGTIAKFESDPASVSGAKALVAMIPNAAQLMASLVKWLGLTIQKTEAARIAIASIERSGTPVIYVGDTPWSTITDEAYGHLVARNTEPTVAAATGSAPVLFQRGGALQRVRTGDDGVGIRAVGNAALRERLGRVCDWVGNLRGLEVSHIQPPELVASNILHMTAWPGVPTLRDVTETPVIGRDGGIVVDPGYAANAQLWYHPSEGFVVPQVSDNPDAETALRARDQLLEVIHDFPFAEDAEGGHSASRTHALAFLLLPFMRDLIDGPTPIHLLDAPTPGTGKTLLARVAALIATGREPRSFSWTTNQEEVRKTITSLLIANAGGVVGVDNIAGTLDSEVWAKLLTDVNWTERLLGTNSMAGGTGVPIRATWFGTGNNLQLSNETVRRSLHIRLVPDSEHPEDRTGFRHPNLVAWVKSERATLVHAALTVARFAYLAREANRLPALPPVGSYESHNALMGGLMALLDMKGWRGNVDRLRETGDAEMAPWRALLPVWYESYPRAEVTIKELMSFAVTRELLPDHLQDNERSDKSRQTEFGQHLKKLADRVVGGYRVTSRLVTGRTLYRARPVDPAAVLPVPEAPPF